MDAVRICVPYVRIRRMEQAHAAAATVLPAVMPAAVPAAVPAASSAGRQQ